MKLCIVGAGAVGGFIAALLAESGQDVSVVARGAHLAAIRDGGLRLDYEGRRVTARVAASDDPADLGAQDAVIVAVKAPSLPGILPSWNVAGGPRRRSRCDETACPGGLFDGFGAPRRSVPPVRSTATAHSPGSATGGGDRPAVIILPCDVPEPGLIARQTARTLHSANRTARSALAWPMVERCKVAGIGAEATGEIQQEVVNQTARQPAFLPRSA